MESQSPLRLVNLPYWLSQYPGETLACDVEDIELLPHFGDIEPKSWEQWILEGGEAMPQEVNP